MEIIGKIVRIIKCGWFKEETIDSNKSDNIYLKH